jgi:putative ABC transport system ATP-binding protein
MTGIVPVPREDAEPVLELVGVRKIYPGLSPVVAMDDVSFTVRRSELVGIVGPSGSGKSTLLHVMGTLDRPTSGSILIEGMDVAELTDRELAAVRATRIGFVFQQFFLDEYSTALENVADGMLYTGESRAERRLAAAQALRKVGLAHRMEHRPPQMSGGERQRVAIARALVGNPAIVLADEPTGNLDSRSAAAIFQLLHDLNRDGVTIIVITHDNDLAARLPRRIELLDGRVVNEHSSAEDGASRLPTP